MTPVAWILVIASLGVGVGAGILAARANGKSRVAANTLVPARTRQLLSVLPTGAVVIRRDRRNAYCNNAALALGVARPDGALHPELARLAEIAWKHGEVVEEDIEVQRGVLASSRTLQARVAVVDDELALALVADQTEQQAAEQMRRNFAINSVSLLLRQAAAVAFTIAVRRFCGSVASSASRRCGSSAIRSRRKGEQAMTAAIKRPVAPFRISGRPHLPSSRTRAARHGLATAAVRGRNRGFRAAASVWAAVEVLRVTDIPSFQRQAEGNDQARFAIPEHDRTMVQARHRRDKA